MCSTKSQRKNITPTENKKTLHHTYLFSTIGITKGNIVIA